MFDASELAQRLDSVRDRYAKSGMEVVGVAEHAELLADLAALGVFIEAIRRDLAKLAGVDFMCLKLLTNSRQLSPALLKQPPKSSPPVNNLKRPLLICRRLARPLFIAPQPGFLKPVASKTSQGSARPK